MGLGGGGLYLGLVKGVGFEGVWRGAEDGVRKGVEDGVWRGVEDGVWRGVEDGVWRGVEDGVWRGVEDGVWRGVGWLFVVTVDVSGTTSHEGSSKSHAMQNNH